MEAERIENVLFAEVAAALKVYTEELILDQASSPTPLEDGVSTLQEIWRAARAGRDCQRDIAGLMKSPESLGTIEINRLNLEGSPGEPQKEDPCY